MEMTPESTAGNRKARRFARPLPLGLFVLTSLVGCQTLDPGLARFPWSEAPKGEVTQVVTIWADGIVAHPDPARGGLPTPGLAGRVYLFGHNKGEPVAAEGGLCVHLYDDAQPPSDQPAPREVWNIDQENLNLVLTKDLLGWGYNLWLPWSNYRADIRKVTLVVQYKANTGREVWSSTMVLGVNDDNGVRTPGDIRAESKTGKELKAAMTARGQ